MLPSRTSTPSGGVASEPEAFLSQPISSAPATVVWRKVSASHPTKSSAAKASAVSSRVVFAAGTSANDRCQRRPSAGTASRPPVAAVVNVRHSLSVTPLGISHVTRTRRASASVVSVRKFVGGAARTASSVIVTFARIHVPFSFV